MALIIPFIRKNSEPSSVDNLLDVDEEKKRIQSRKIRIISQNGQRIISIDKFKFQKEETSEYQKLKEGLIVKIHKHKQSLLEQYKNNTLLDQSLLDQVQEDLLDICADYAENILDSEESSLVLLGKYGEFKKTIGHKFAKLTGNLNTLINLAERERLPLLSD